MLELRIQLDQSLKKIGTSHLVPDGCDEDLHKFVCRLLCVDKINDLSFQHLNKTSSTLDYTITIEDKKRIYKTVSTYEKSIALE